MSRITNSTLDRRSELRRGPMPQRSTKLARGRMKRKARPASETTRIYGTPQHRAWMKELPCYICGETPSDAAHIRNGGTGRKADWQQTIPLCSDTIHGPGHHTAFDAAKKTWRARYDLPAIAAHYAALWERIA